MQYQRSLNTGEFAYHFQGIFSSAEKAEAECKTNQYYIIPATIDETLPHESFVCDEHYFPLK
jgi:hypothetical protein